MMHSSRAMMLFVLICYGISVLRQPRVEFWDVFSFTVSILMVLWVFCREDVCEE